MEIPDIPDYYNGPHGLKSGVGENFAYILE